MNREEQEARNGLESSLLDQQVNHLADSELESFADPLATDIDQVIMVEKPPKNKWKRAFIWTVSILLFFMTFLLFWACFPLLENDLPTIYLPIEKLTNVPKIRRENGSIYLEKPDIAEKGFKILLFTDTHFSFYKIRQQYAVTGMVGHITREKPDLVIITGDVSMGIFMARKNMMIAKIMERFGVPFAFIMGNHDAQVDFSIDREEVIRLYTTFPHAVMDLGPNDVEGFGNYYIHITDGKDIIRTLFFLDSGKYTTREEERRLKLPFRGYDYIKESQIRYYNQTMDSITFDDRIVPSTVFVHIPLPEYAEAIKTETPIRGKMRENPHIPSFNSHFFDVILAKKSTDSVYCGHDHVNDFVVDYKGIRLAYVQSSGYSLYNPLVKWPLKGGPHELVGCTLMEIDHNGNFTDRVFFNKDFPEYFEGLGKIWFFGL